MAAAALPSLADVADHLGFGAHDEEEELAPVPLPDTLGVCLAMMSPLHREVPTTGADMGLMIERNVRIAAAAMRAYRSAANTASAAAMDTFLQAALGGGGSGGDGDKALDDALHTLCVADAETARVIMGIYLGETTMRGDDGRGSNFEAALHSVWQAMQVDHVSDDALTDAALEAAVDVDVDSEPRSQPPSASQGAAVATAVWEPVRDAILLLRSSQVRRCLLPDSTCMRTMRDAVHGELSLLTTVVRIVLLVRSFFPCGGRTVQLPRQLPPLSRFRVTAGVRRALLAKVCDHWLELVVDGSTADVLRDLPHVPSAAASARMAEVLAAASPTDKAAMQARFQVLLQNELTRFALSMQMQYPQLADHTEEMRQAWLQVALAKAVAARAAAAKPAAAAPSPAFSRSRSVFVTPEQQQQLSCRRPPPQLASRAAAMRKRRLLSRHYGLGRRTKLVSVKVPRAPMNWRRQLFRDE